MKKLFLLVLPLLFLTGCSTSKIESVLQEDGYTNVSLYGFPMLTCGGDDSAWTSKHFKAEKDGKSVEGTVCCGLLFKGCVIRK